MLWTTTSLYIQIVAGFVGAHIAAAVARDQAFGFWGHTVAGLIAGALGGFFLQTYAATVVTASGSLNEIRPADNFVLQTAAGAALGGICMLAVGMIAAHRRSPPSD